MLWAMTARTKKPNAQNAGHLQEAAEEVIMYGGFLKEAINTGIFHWKNGTSTPGWVPGSPRNEFDDPSSRVGPESTK